MARLRISRAAERDLQNIADFISSDNPQAAIRFLSELNQQIARIARQPELYPQRSDLRPGVHLCPFRRYVILFRQTTYGVRIMRVLHSARDLARII